MVFSGRQGKWISEIRILTSMCISHTHRWMNEHEEDEPPIFKEGYTAFESGADSITGSSTSLPADVHLRDGDSASVQEELVRTQVYLSVEQRDFLRDEGQKHGVSMAAALRKIINERMKPAVVSWEGNPLLDDVVVDPGFKSTGKGFGSIDADASIYGKYES